MFTFQVKDMTCGHCVRSITEAVTGIDHDAKVDIDLQRQMVAVQSEATLDEVSQAIQEAGYSPTVVNEAARLSSDAPASRRQGGCCCR